MDKKRRNDSIKQWTVLNQRAVEGKMKWKETVLFISKMPYDRPSYDTSEKKNKEDKFIEPS